MKISLTANMTGELVVEMATVKRYMAKEVIGLLFLFALIEHTMIVVEMHIASINMDTVSGG